MVSREDLGTDLYVMVFTIWAHSSSTMLSSDGLTRRIAWERARWQIPVRFWRGGAYLGQLLLRGVSDEMIRGWMSINTPLFVLVAVYSLPCM